MAKETEENFFNNDIPIQSPEDMFATETSDSISESDVFAGTEDFHKTLSQLDDGRKPKKSSKEKRHYSTSQKVLVLGITTLLITLICVLITPRSKKTTDETFTATPKPADQTLTATPKPADQIFKC